MTDFNKVTVHGRIVKNAEFTTTDAGLYVARFTIAVNKSRRLSDGTFAPEDDTSFLNLAVFGKYASTVGPHLLKGRGVMIEGHLRQNRWEKDGEKRSEISIVVEKIYFDPMMRKEMEEVLNPASDPVVPMTPETECIASAAFDFPPVEASDEFAIF